MKNSRQALLLKLTAILSLIAVVVQPACAGVPKVTLAPSVIFDNVCSQKTGYKINGAWRDELNARLPTLRTNWNTEGVKLLATTTEITGKPFNSKDYRVTLSICSFPSMSDPLLVNMRYSLKSFTKNALPPDVSISIIYHEILHLYLADIIPKNSPLLKKYSHESQTVKDHLHLFALMKAVYLSLGEKKHLLDIIKKDDSLPNPDYRRTWKIINAGDNYRLFTDDLKQRS